MHKHGSEEHPRGGRPTSNELAELALAVYVEELALQKKVLFIGDPSSAAPERLARAARSVELVSTRSRVRGTRRGGRVASRRWPGAEDAGRWDLVLVPDLPAAGLADEAKLAEAARWLAPGGVLVTGTPDPEGPAGHPGAIAYEALFDLLDGAFEHVRMLGQAPFAGFSVVDFAPSDVGPGGELGVTFDGSILEGKGERAQRYFALCGDRDVVLDAYAVVQVPSEAQAKVRERGELEGRLREQQDALDAANVHAEELERELEAARAEASAALLRGQDSDTRRAAALAEERAGVAAKIAALEAELASSRDALARERASAREGAEDGEYAALEASLEARGRELIELRAEVSRRGTLVRDLVEELREAQAQPGASGEIVAGAAERAAGPLEAAVERAVVAETARAELEFRLDEVRAQLLVAERGSTEELEALRRLEAELRGTARGLHARVAELAERHQQTQARLALAEDDRAAAEARNRRLVRELAESREQLELEIARERMATDAVDGGELARLRALEQSAAAREGQLLGALMQAREEAAELAAQQHEGRGEAAGAREALLALEHRVEGMRAGYEARIAELVRELDEVSGQAERALASAGELRARLAAREGAEAALRGELEGARRRLADREAAVESLRAASAPASGLAGRPDPAEGPVAFTARVAALEGELDASREEARALRARVDELGAALEGARRAPATVEYARDTDIAARLAATIGARDALVARLQRELADASERRHSLERRLDECATKLARSREELESARAVADVRGLESGRELDDLSARLERSERERREAVEGLEEARAILTQLAGELPARRGGDGDGAASHELRERLARLDAEAADREVLLRSLTAQLQERDDRIRALERLRGGAEDGDEPGALRQRLFEMEERVARLTDELEHERAARHRAENPPS